MSLAKEMKKLCQEPLDGIKVVMNDEDVTDVAAEITGPGKRAAHAHTEDSPPHTHACAANPSTTNFESGAAPAGSQTRLPLRRVCSRSS